MHLTINNYDFVTEFITFEKKLRYVWRHDEHDG